MIKISEHLTLKAWSKSKSLAMKFKSGIKIGSTNLTPTLKAVEEAAKKDDHEALIEALKEVVEVARKNLSNKAVDDDAREQLQRIVEEGKKALPRIAEEGKKVQKAADAKAGGSEAKAPIGSGSVAKIPIFNKKMASDLKVSGLTTLKPPDFTFKVELVLDGGVFKQLQKDGLLLEELNAMFQKNYDMTAKAITSKLKAFDGMVQKAIDQNRPKAEIQKLVDGLNKAFDEDKRVAEAACEIEAGKMWVDLARKRTEYTKYKAKIVVTVVGAATTLAVSIALMAATPFSFGASTVPAILTMVKAANTLVTEISSAALTVEGCQKMLGKQLSIVETAKAAAEKKLGVKGARIAMLTNDTSAAIIKEFIGVSQPCIKSCEDQCSTMLSKLGGAEVRCHDLSKLLNGLLDKQEKFQREFMEGAAKRAKESASSKTAADLKEIERRLEAKLEKNYVSVTNAIEKTSRAYTAMKASKEEAKKLQVRVAALGGRPALLKLLTGVLALKDLAFMSVGGSGLVQASELITNIVPTATMWTYDRLTEGVFDGTFLGKKV